MVFASECPPKRHACAPASEPCLHQNPPARSALDSADQSAGCAPQQALLQKSHLSAEAPVGAPPAPARRLSLQSRRARGRSLVLSGSRMHPPVVKPVRTHRLARIPAIVPIQLIVECASIVRKIFALRIWVCTHLVKRQLRHGEG